MAAPWLKLQVFLILAITTSPTSGRAPDTSLMTTPVAYYGANWNRSQVNIDVLARLQMVVLMQEDGHCWATCCPRRFNQGSQCGWQPTDPDATTYQGCDGSCNEHGSQEDVFKRIAISAQQQRLRGPHAVLYMNSVYLWPFDRASALGSSVMVTDVNGKPHEENCDPGIYPSYFFDFGKPAGAKAWLDIIYEHVVNGAADGVYCDCCGLVPFHCSGNGTCIAKRNGHIKSVNERVTQSSVDAHIVGKNATLHEAIRLVTDPNGNNGTFYNKVRNKDFNTKGNIEWMKVGPPPQLHGSVLANLADGNYVVVGGANSFSNPKTETPSSGQNLADGRSLQRCSDDMLAQFLLAVEPGAFLLCNGWDARFGRPLGLPMGPPALASDNTTWSRNFISGVVATWNTATSSGTVTWPGVPTPAPTQPTPRPPSPRPTPSRPVPPCPGPECPPVPAAHYKGCFTDKVNHQCDLPYCQTGHCGKPNGCSKPYIANMTVELCNALCNGYAFFALQAGGHGCFCGQSFGRFGEAPGKCIQMCGGNTTEVCGGPNVNSVYASVPISEAPENMD